MTRSTSDIGEPMDGADWEALGRYVAGESSAREVEEVRRWLAADPAREQVIASLDRLTRRVAARPLADLDVEGALRRVKARMNGPEVAAHRDRLPAAPRVAPRPYLWQSSWLRAAAAIALVATGALVWRSVRAPVNAIQVATLHETGVGERRAIDMPDGSRLMLGPDSRFVVRAGFGAEARDVELTGDGYFDVAHDDARAFTVHANGAIVRVVGTAFVVRARPSTDRPVQVAVRTGSVLLHAAGWPGGDGVVLGRGDRGVLDPDGRATAHRGEATDEDLAWTEGRLLFRDAPMTDVADALRRWYGIELRAEGALAGRHITASFEGEPVARVLEVIALALGADVERRGDTAIVRSRVGGGTPP